MTLGQGPVPQFAARGSPFAFRVSGPPVPSSRRANWEPRTENREPEPKTANREPRTEKQASPRNPVRPHVRLERRGNRHRAVLLLEVLEDRDEGATDRQAGAVQRVDEIRLAGALPPELDVRA